MTDDEQRMRTINNDAQLTTRTITNRVDSTACWCKRINGTWGWKVKQSECGSKANDQRVVTTAHSWLHNGGPVCFLCWVVSQANFCVSHSQLASPKNTCQIRWQNKYSKTRHWTLRNCMSNKHQYLCWLEPIAERPRYEWAKLMPNIQLCISHLALCTGYIQRRGTTVRSIRTTLSPVFLQGYITSHCWINVDTCLSCI